jgi:sec-independent protein translocase protein TatB
MFDIGWSELVIIAIVALIAIGPKELPGVLRTVGNYMGKIRRMASEFQGQFQEAMREAEMADLKKSVDDITDTAKGYTDSFTGFDPLASVKKEVESLSADPLGTSAAASASPEAASPATPAPLSPDAGIEPVPVAAAAPQPGERVEPEAKAETQPDTRPGTAATGSGA